MENITSYNRRKIINLIFLLLTVVILLISTLIKNASQSNLMLWEMMLSSSTKSDVKAGAIACGVLFAIIVVASLLTISKVLKKHNNTYFAVQGFISVILAIMLVVGITTKIYSTFSIVLIVFAILVNIMATAYAFLIVKYHYDEIFNESNNEEDLEKENKEDTSDESK